jgi:L-2-aminoadipate reductase
LVVLTRFFLVTQTLFSINNHNHFPSRTAKSVLLTTMSQLPDPTASLDWSGYVGSIQSHFSENARKYPDRLCVVETKSSESAERRYTYKQIYEASNVLAHYLHDAGVTNGDVVMIWAHRSVDLVVSMMATLVQLSFSQLMIY